MQRRLPNALVSPVCAVTRRACGRTLRLSCKQVVAGSIPASGSTFALVSTNIYGGVSLPVRAHYSNRYSEGALECRRMSDDTSKRVMFTVPAGSGEAFGPRAFDGAVGRRIVFGRGHALVVGATVADDGSAATLELDIDDTAATELRHG